jgi:NADH:ubiquinone oxidoreductase subunit 4 (subunit M)
MLSFFRSAFGGPLVRPENQSLPDLRRLEAAALLPLLLLILLVGILPNLIFRTVDASAGLALERGEVRRVAQAEDPDQLAGSGRAEDAPAWTAWHEQSEGLP